MSAHGNIIKPEMMELFSFLYANHFEYLLRVHHTKATNDALEKNVIKRTEKLEEAQTVRLQEAKRYRKKLEDFVERVVHEIRNPLTGIDGMTGFLSFFFIF